MNIRLMQHKIALELVRVKGVEERTQAFDDLYFHWVGVIRSKWTDEQVLDIFDLMGLELPEEV